MVGWFSKKKKEKPDFRFYLIEDDESAREYFVAMLESIYNCEVIAFSNLEDAVKGIDSTDKLPDVIVSDVRLPGNSGFLIQAELENREVEIPVVFVTGLGGADVDDGERIVLSKPVSKLKLKKYLDRFVA